MRKVVFLIGVQVVCISLAAAALSGLTLYLALEMPVAGRHRSFTGLYQGANLVAAWTACVFGGASEYRERASDVEPRDRD